MINKERKLAKAVDTPNRCRAFTEAVYSGVSDNPEKLKKEVFALEKRDYPSDSPYHVYFGEMHGHTCMSDGRPTVDEYFRNIRDNAKLDFAAISDHDHGGIGKAELWKGNWEIIKEKVREYNEPGKFTTILAYERDSYPWYDNLIVYYNNYDGALIRGEVDGEITAKELADLLAREDTLIIPHDTYYLNAGADFNTMPPELFTPMIEICSRGDCAEYFGNPYNGEDSQVEGGFWQDALKRGARMGCIGGSDDHACKNGITLEPEYEGDLRIYPGITGVLAEENTLESIFAALKARRCFAFTGGRMEIDFRINGHFMGEEFACREERKVFYSVKTDTPIKRVTVVKNCRDYILLRRPNQLFFDHKVESDCDVYYLRVELTDGRCGWTSPIWVRSE